jgi:ribosomal protein L3
MSEAITRTYRLQPMNSKECQACAGTGDPSPWEHDHHVWMRGEAIAVCGACRGAGIVGRWGFRISPAKHLASLRRSHAILFGPAS